MGLAALVFAGAASATAQFQMPDPKQMAGIPRPVDDLPAGSISVRLIRGQLSNNITNHPVELHAGSRVVTVTTDEGGRAQFDKLTPGVTVKAVAVVDGERLESQEFPVPAQGGIRLMLVATDKSQAGATAPAAAPIAGDVTLGGDSRIVIEPGDEALSVYFLLEFVNSGGAPVNPRAPLVFDLPAGATGATILEGSSSLASVKGARVSVKSPFPPGRTVVQVACELPITGGSMDISQKFPASFERLLVLVKKVGDTKLGSRQIERQQDFPGEGGTVIGAVGKAVAADQPIVLSLTDLPHRSAVPRWTTLSLAAAILFVGVWVASRPQDAVARDAERKRLVTRREKLFSDLVRLEKDHRNGRGGDDARYATRREELVAALEHVYGALDDPNDRAGVAA